MTDTAHPSRFAAQARAALRFDPVRVDVRHGMRLAAIVGAPLIAGLAADRLDIALFATLAALNVGLADPGGPYRRRLIAMVIGAIAMTAAIAISSAVVGNPIVVVVLTALWALLCALGADIGPAASGVSFVTAVVFIVGLGLPEGDPDIAFRVVWFLIGSAWALAATFVIWPIRPDAPVHDALDSVYTRVARFLAEMPHDDGSRSRARDEIAADLVSARDVTVYGDRTQRTGVRHAISALKAAESIELGLGALDRAMGQLPHPPAVLTDAIAATERSCRSIAASLRSGEPWDTTGLRSALEGLASAELHGPAQLARGALLRMATELSHPGTAWPDAPSTSESRPAIAVRLSALIDVESLVLRHALRLAVVVGIAEVFALLDPFERGYWIPLTVVTVLKPDLGSTLDRGLQRIVGTMVGVLLALVIVLVFGDDPWVLTACLILLTFAIGTVIEANYGVGVVAITPSIIVLLSIDGANPDVAFARLFDTLVGGALALLGGLLLWPMWERTTLGGTMGAAAAAAADYLRRVTDGSSVREIRRAHRIAERRRSNAEASLRRMLSEPRKHWVAPANVMSYCGRTRSIIENTTGLRMTAVHEIRDDRDRTRRLSELADDVPAELDAIGSMFDDVEAEPFGAVDRDAAKVNDDIGGEAPRGVDDRSGSLQLLGEQIHADAESMRRSAIVIARRL